ncbi:MAG: hypothetical protein O6934_14070 [SAR324 cluster bacterium]|nr:hypothetical protein [SAR324 cluster bacterium]MCZ6645111.1 hypothetical protein [SAR324 cluster bacterium]MCZ6842701.1 hypothetical protein [SAR324 cluster bacterium]
MTRPPITMKDPTWFFMPLIFTAELMMISHSIIHGFLARLEAPTVTLAAFSIAFILHGVTGSPLWVGPQVAIAFISDRRSVLRLFWFQIQAALAPTAVMLAVSWTPAGEWLYAEFMGASAEVVRQAQQATVYFALVFFVVPFRNTATALIMLKRRTALITLGTLVRLLSLGGSLYLLPFWFGGASVGALALFLCIAVESLFSLAMARAFYLDLPGQRGAPVAYGELWRFSWPLMLNQAAEGAVFFLINFFLGRLARPDLALAAFGVMRGIQMLLLSSLRNLAQTAQTLTRSREDLRVMLRFSFWVVLAHSLIALLVFVTPVRWWLLYTVMGLSRELAEYIAMPLVLSFVVAVFWGYSSLFKGLMIALRRTGSLAVTGFVRIAVVIAVGSVTLIAADINGALVGVLAFAGAFAAECAVLFWQLFLGGRAASLFPAHEEATEKATGE